jgi:hypothetical protein
LPRPRCVVPDAFLLRRTLHFWPDVPGKLLDMSGVDLGDPGNIAENRAGDDRDGHWGKC